jgi:hypothetical protein
MYFNGNKKEFYMAKSYLLLSPRFHGTTIIGRMLSAGGSTSYFGDGLVNHEIDNQFCGCGLTVHECEIWNQIEILEQEFVIEKFSIFKIKWIIYIINILNLTNIFLYCKSYYDMVRNESNKFVKTKNIENKLFFIDGQKSLKRAFILDKNYCNINGFIQIKRNKKDYLMSCLSSGDSFLKLPQRYFECVLYNTVCSFLFVKMPGMVINYDEFVLDPLNVINEGRNFIGLECMSIEDISSFLKLKSHFLGNASAYNFKSVRRKN